MELRREEMAETKVEVKTQRQKRRPFGLPQSKLTVEKKLDGYHYRWINDTPGRVAQALAGAYTFVEPAEVGREPNGENKVFEYGGTNKDGSPMRVYLMRIAQEFYLEDKTSATQYLDEIDASIRGGKISQTAGDKRYVPEHGISYKNN
jgi:hypothetical protein